MIRSAGILPIGPRGLIQLDEIGHVALLEATGASGHMPARECDGIPNDIMEERPVAPVESAYCLSAVLRVKSSLRYYDTAEWERMRDSS